jgi:hypothetical protein
MLSQKDEAYREKGLEEKITKSIDLTVVRSKLVAHFAHYGLDTVAYLRDPSKDDEMKFVIDNYPRYTVDSAREHGVLSPSSTIRMTWSTTGPLVPLCSARWTRRCTKQCTVLSFRTTRSLLPGCCSLKSYSCLHPALCGHQAEDCRISHRRRVGRTLRCFAPRSRSCATSSTKLVSMSSRQHRGEPT